MYYTPILKLKQGELKALENLTEPEHLSVCRPLVELLGEVAEEGHEPLRDLAQQIAVKLARSWSGDRPPLRVDADNIDLGADDENEARGLLPAILEALESRGVAAIPVVRLGSAPTVAPALAEWVGEHDRQACIRITSEDLDDTAVPLPDLLQEVCGALQVASEDVDLILDFGAVEDQGSQAMAARLGRFILPGLLTNTWRSATVASGAFPVNLSQVPAYTFGRLPRFDWMLWESLSALRWTQPVEYGDYAVTHPALQTGVAFAAPPQVRYALPDEWLVIKGRRNDRRGHSQYFDLCAQTIATAGMEATRDESWGDVQMGQASRSIGGPGNASTWRAHGTSQHIGRVLRQLRGRGVA